MKLSIYGIMAYVHDTGHDTSWPVPPGVCDVDLCLQNYKEGIEQILMAESLGFDWVSLSEHHYYNRSMSGVPMILGAYLGGKLTTMKVAMLGHHMPLNNPIRVAEEMATLDNLTEGKFIAGLLRGTPNEFQVYGANPEETRDRTTEGMELVLKAWTEPQPFAWEGRFFQYRTVSVWPRPMQRPYPPTYVLGNSKETCEFAAKHRLGMGVSFGTFEINGRSTEYYRDCCEREGWTPDPERIIYRGRAYVAETDEQAEYDLEHYWVRDNSTVRAAPSIVQTVRALDPNPFHTGGAPLPGRSDHLLAVAEQRGAAVNFYGSPATVIEQIKAAREILGAGVIDLCFQGPALAHEHVTKSLELFGKEVLPAVRDL